MTCHEVGLAAFGRDEDGREALFAIGEAKWNKTMGLGHLQRLDRILASLRARDGVHAERTQAAVLQRGRLHR